MLGNAAAHVEFANQRFARGKVNAQGTQLVDGMRHVVPGKIRERVGLRAVEERRTFSGHCLDRLFIRRIRGEPELPPKLQVIDRPAVGPSLSR